MKTIHIILLLATAALAAGDSGTISIRNTIPFQSTLSIQYLLKNVTQKQESSLAGAETKTVTIPEDATDIKSIVAVPFSATQTKIFTIFSAKPFKTSLKVEGSARFPRVGDVTVVPADSRSITVLNKGIFCGILSVGYNFKGSQHNERALIPQNGINIVVIPDDASDVIANVSCFNSVFPNCGSGPSDEPVESVLNTTVSGLQCYQLLGRCLEQKIDKIDCVRTHIHVP